MTRDVPLGNSTPAFDWSLGGVVWRLAVAPLPVIAADLGLRAFWMSQPLAYALSVLMMLPFVALAVAVPSSILGLPIYFLFKRFHWKSHALFAIGGAFAAALFYAVPTALPHSASFQFVLGACRVIEDGQRTACGWVQFFEGVVLNLGLGAVSGLVFRRLLQKPAPAAA